MRARSYSPSIPSHNAGKRAQRPASPSSTNTQSAQELYTRKTEKKQDAKTSPNQAINTTTDAIQKKEERYTQSQGSPPPPTQTTVGAGCVHTRLSTQPPCSRAASAADSPKSHHTGASAAVTQRPPRPYAPPPHPHSISEKRPHMRAPAPPPTTPSHSPRTRVSGGRGRGNRKAQPAPQPLRRAMRQQHRPPLRSRWGLPAAATHPRG